MRWAVVEAIAGQIFDDATPGKPEVSYDVDRFKEIAEANYPTTPLPLGVLLDLGAVGHNESDESDSSKKFHDRIRWLTLEKYQSHDYPPILVARLNGSLDIIDGRHRTLKVKWLSKKGYLDPWIQPIDAYLVNLDDPRQKKLFEPAEL